MIIHLKETHVSGHHYNHHSTHITRWLVSSELRALENCICVVDLSSQAVIKNSGKKD